MRTENLESTNSSERSKGVLSSRTLFSRDINYLRDVTLVWPFIIYSIIGVASSFSPPDRLLGLKCIAVAIAALLLAKEKLLLFLGVLGFIAIQSAIALLLHPWSWAVFTAGVLTGTPFLVANRYWRKPKLSYRLPDEFGAVDMLLSFASICGSIMLIYVVSPPSK